MADPEIVIPWFGHYVNLASMLATLGGLKHSSKQLIFAPWWFNLYLPQNNKSSYILYFIVLQKKTGLTVQQVALMVFTLCDT